jgi:hypothetical protein
MALILSLTLLACPAPAAGQESTPTNGQEPAVTAETPAPTAQELLEQVDMPKWGLRELNAWRDYLVPTQEEAAFEALPWRNTFAQGLQDADAAGRPLLLWVMNGHPLGCT